MGRFFRKLVLFGCAIAFAVIGAYGSTDHWFALCAGAAALSSVVLAAT
jgi:hypothetical protein